MRTAFTARYSKSPYTKQIRFVFKRLKSKKYTFFLQSVFIRFAWIPNKQLNWLVFITETECVHCAVRNETSTVTKVIFRLPLLIWLSLQDGCTVQFACGNWRNSERQVTGKHITAQNVSTPDLHRSLRLESWLLFFPTLFLSFSNKGWSRILNGSRPIPATFYTIHNSPIITQHSQ
jgi:hypothetical protein